MAGEYILVFDITGTDIALKHTRHETTASSLRADKCCFYFDSDWDDYGGKMALFGADRDRLKPVLLSVDRDEEQRTFYYCYIPRDVLAQLSAGGNIYIAVQGEQATAGFTPAATDALEQVSALRTKFYNLNIADSGQIEFYITAQEEADFLAQVGAALSTMRSENNAAIALLEGKSIKNATINAAHELVITMQNGTVYNLGNVKGAKGDKGDKGDTGATGAQGPRGVGISNIIMNADGDLTVYTSDSSAYPVGHVKGDKGDTGERGAQGLPGEKGVKGDKGDPGTTLYSDLSDKPQINGVVLNGNKTSAELGLQPALVSGTNLKTVNGTSLLGTGDVPIGLTPAPRSFYILYGLHRIYEALNDGVYQVAEDHYVGVFITGKTKTDDYTVYKDSIFTVNKATKTVYCFGRTSFAYTLTGEDSFTGGAIGKDGVFVSGVSVALDAQNRRVFTFTMSDGTTRDVVLPGEVITITHDEQSKSVSVEEFAQGITDSLFFFESGINNLETNKADKNALMYECDVQMQGDAFFFTQEAIDELYRLKPAFLKANIYAEGVVIIKQIYYLISANNIPTMEYEGPLVYQVYNYDFSETNNNYVRIEIPKNAANPVMVNDVTFQEKIDSNHKLSADAVDDTGAVHKFVSAEEKAVWNGKADKTVVTGTDGTQYAVRFTMAAGKPAIEYREVITNE